MPTGYANATLCGSNATSPLLAASMASGLAPTPCAPCVYNPVPGPNATDITAWRFDQDNQCWMQVKRVRGVHGRCKFSMPPEQHVGQRGPRHTSNIAVFPVLSSPACEQDMRRVQACPLDSSAAGPARAAALLWRQKQFADFLGSPDVQVIASFSCDALTAAVRGLLRSLLAGGKPA